MRVDAFLEPIADYNKAVDSAETVEDLVHNLRAFRKFAEDAFQIASQMQAVDFHYFREGLLLERKQKFAGEKWANLYSAILIPRIMMEVGLIANTYQVPWGLAFNRLLEIGAIKLGKEDRAQWVGFPSQES